MKIRILFLTMCMMGVCSISASYAAGFGVSGQQTQADTPQGQQIEHLLTGSQGSMSGLVDTRSQNQFVSNPSMLAPPTSKQSASKNGGNAGKRQDPIGQAAFAGVAHSMMPLTPDQIKVLRYLFDQSQRAASEYPGTPPKPTSSTVAVDLSPGAAPPIIRLQAGYVTSLVFLDASGQPWPIVAYDLGNPNAFNIEPKQPNGRSDTLLVQASDAYKSGNLAVMLKGENTPIMITLMPGQRAVDYRVDLRIPALGPNANPNTVNLPTATSNSLLNFLDGVPPQGAEPLQVEGGPCEAWLYQHHLFLRTRLTVLSPSFLSTTSSPDGTNVYKLVKTPIVLASLRGQMIKLQMKGL